MHLYLQRLVERFNGGKIFVIFLQAENPDWVLDVHWQYTLGYTDGTLAYTNLVHWSPSIYNRHTLTWYI